MMFAINDDNYQVYKRVYEIIWKNEKMLITYDLPEDADPLNIINSWESESKSMARKGLKAGLLDIFSHLDQLPKATIDNIDKELIENKLPNVIQLRDLITDMISKIIKRGKIRNEDEYYAVKETVIDVDSNYPRETIELLNHIINEFESNSIRKYRR